MFKSVAAYFTGLGDGTVLLQAASNNQTWLVNLLWRKHDTLDLRDFFQRFDLQFHNGKEPTTATRVLLDLLVFRILGFIEDVWDFELKFVKIRNALKPRTISKPIKATLLTDEVRTENERLKDFVVQHDAEIRALLNLEDKPYFGLDPSKEWPCCIPGGVWTNDHFGLIFWSKKPRPESLSDFILVENEKINVFWSNDFMKNE